MRNIEKALKSLYKELDERRTHLEERKETPITEGRIDENLLIMVRVQQLILDNLDQKSAINDQNAMDLENENENSVSESIDLSKVRSGDVLIFKNKEKGVVSYKKGCVYITQDLDDNRKQDTFITTGWSNNGIHYSYKGYNIIKHIKS